jgi:hypothetical protein
VTRLLRSCTVALAAATALTAVTAATSATAGTASPPRAATSGTPSAAATAKPLPTHDAFYRYTGKKPLRRIKPGTVLKQRSVTISLGTTASPIPATQLLYRTVNERHRPAVTVTTVITPSTTAAVPRVISYLSFYDALGPECDPSYTLTGGNSGTSNEQQAEIEEALIATYVTDGATVEIPDFEGEDLHWAAGQESGWSTLDSVRATENALHFAAKTTPVALTGYSGGAIAADWASELAPHYAPAMDLVGVAEGGIPVDFAHNLKYVNGSPSWSGVIPAVLVSSGRAFGVNIGHYLSAKGRRLTRQVSGECIGSFEGAYPGLTIQSLLKKRYRNFLAQPVFARIVNHLTMGTEKGHPAEPLDMFVGDQDGTGDGVMVTKDVQALAHEYCAQGTPVTFTEVPKASHEDAAAPFEASALAFVQARLDGAPFTGESCSMIGTGNSLKPLPVAHHH